MAARCTFSMDELAYQYPEERTMPGLTPQQALEKLTWEGAAERYPEGLPDEVRPKIEHELRLIEQWGSGIQRMTSACQDAGLAAPGSLSVVGR